MSFKDSPKGAFVIIDYAVSALAIISNLIALDSVLRVQFSLAGYRRFLISLICSDLYISLVHGVTFCMPLFASSSSPLSRCNGDFVRIFQIVGFIANLLNLCGMTIDHYLGILHPLRYREFMSKRVTCTIIILIWVIAFFIGFFDFFYGTVNYVVQMLWHETNEEETGNNELPKNFVGQTENVLPVVTTSESIDPAFFSGNSDDYADAEGIPMFNWPPELAAILHSMANNANISMFLNISNEAVNDSSENKVSSGILSILNERQQQPTGWCLISQRGQHGSMWLEFCVMTLTTVCFIFLIVCYGRIFKDVTFGNYNSKSERKLRRLILTTFFLLGSFTICWVPFMSIELTMIVILHSTNFNVEDSTMMNASASYFAVHTALYTLLLCSPLLDPIIYAARIRAIRQNILLRYVRLFPCCHRYLERLELRNRKRSVIPYPVVRRLTNGSTSVTPLLTNTYCSSAEGCFDESCTIRGDDLETGGINNNKDSSSGAADYYGSCDVTGSQEGDITKGDLGQEDPEERDLKNVRHRRSRTTLRRKLTILRNRLFLQKQKSVGYPLKKCTDVTDGGAENKKDIEKEVSSSEKSVEETVFVEVANQEPISSDEVMSSDKMLITESINEQYQQDQQEKEPMSAQAVVDKFYANSVRLFTNYNNGDGQSVIGNELKMTLLDGVTTECGNVTRQIIMLPMAPSPNVLERMTAVLMSTTPAETTPTNNASPAQPQSGPRRVPTKLGNFLSAPVVELKQDNIDAN